MGGMTVPEVARITFLLIQQYNCRRMIAYIMGFIKFEEVQKSVHNRILTDILMTVPEAARITLLLIQQYNC